MDIKLTWWDKLQWLAAHPLPWRHVTTYNKKQLTVTQYGQKKVWVKYRSTWWQWGCWVWHEQHRAMGNA